MIKQSPKAVVCNPILAKQSSKNAVNARINFFLNKLNIKSDNRFKALIRICVILFVTLISNYTLQAQFGPNDDFDGDLIINSIDIDDDNDGILDDDENTCSGTVVDVNWNNNQNTNLMGNRESVFQENGVTFSTNDFISSTVDIQFGAGLGTVNTVFPPNNSGSGIYDDQFEYDIRGTADATTFAEAKMNDDYFEFTFTMSQTAYLQNVATGLNPTDFGGTGIADYSLAVEISDDGTFNGNEIILTENTFHESTQNSSSYRYTNIGAGVELTAGVTYTVRYYPFDEQNSLLPDNSITFDDVFMQIECFSDIDGDGIANSFDLDSDDDGCPDVLEAGTLGVNDENGTVENDTLTGGIDMDGVPNIAMGGTTPIDQFDDMLPNFQDSLWKMACQEPFDCLSNAYMVQGVTSEWNDLNLSKGTTEINNDNYLLEINAIGFNLIDSTITGLTVSAPNQNRLSVTTRNTDGTYCTSLSPIITGMPADEYPAGDVDQNGILHVWGDGTMYRIDADPSSATYGTLLSSTTTTGIPTGTLHDWAFSPLDNQIYAVSSNTAQDILYKINPITGVVENLGSNGIEDVNPSDTEQGSGILYGASYFDSDGNFFVQNNTSGKIYRLDLSPAPGADYDESLTVLASQSVGGLISNDGAKCPTSPVSLFIDFSDLEAFGSANHVHCTDATAGVPDNPDAVWLGTLVDFDNNQLNSADALGDDDDGLDDEDAISNFPANLVSGTPSMFTLTLNSNNAVEVFYGVWLDYNGDGNINEFIDGSAMTASPVDVIVNINPNVTVGDSVKVRVRVDTVALVSADINGSKLNGEVEDWIISQGVCPEITMNTISITENDVCMGVAAPTIEGTAPVLDPVTEFTYQWQSRNGTDPFADIASANMEDLMPGVITATTEYRRIVLVDDCPNDTTTVSVTINVNPLPTITNASTSEVISSGDMSSGFTFVSSPTGATFSWTSAAVGAAGNTALGTGNIPAETLFAIGESVGEVIYTVTPTLNGCDGETVDFTVLVNALPEPDENVTFVNIPVEGDLATNDVLIPMGSTYANPEADVSNPTTDLPTVNADGTYEFETDTPGSYTFEIEITTPEGDIVTETLVITVLDSNSDANPPLANTDQGTTQFDTPVTLSTLSNDLSGDEGVMLDPTTVAVTTGPQNGTVMIDPNTGEITYTPNAGYVGMDTLTYTVLDDNNMLATAQQIITVLPTGADNTTTATDDNGSGLYNDPVSGNVLDNDMDAEGNGQQTTPQTTTISGVGTLELDDMGSYLFTPVAGFFGPVDFPYAVTDDNGSPATDMATLHILISPPTCEDFENGDADICAILSADADSPVGAIDCDEDGNTNAEECLDPNNPSDPGEPCSNLYETGAEVCAFVTANPTSALALADCDGGGVPNVIECTNGGNPLDTIDDLMPEPDENVTFVNIPVEGDLATNDVLIPMGSTYANPEADVSNPTTDLPTVNADGTYEFETDTPGSYTFEIEITTPEGDIVTETLVITVLDSNSDANPPLANTDQGTTQFDTPVTLSTLSNDLSGDEGVMLDPTTVAVTTGPQNGTVMIDPNTGEITYTPNAGYVGMDTLTYTVLDDNNMLATAQQIITVLPTGADNTTTATDDNGSGLYNDPVSGNVLDNDMDAEGNGQQTTPQTTTISGVGTLELDDMGSYLFTPVAGFFGPVDFPYAVTDDNGSPATDMATLHILISPPTCEDFENGDADICAILSADADSPVGAIDCDEDGNTNAEECLDPNNPSDPGEPCSNLYETGAEVCAFVTANPTSALALADCDGGGVPNVIECTNGGNPLESQDDCISAGDANFDVCIYVLTNPMSELALSDCDGGGVSNILECLAGDDPLDPTDDINPRPDENVTYVEVPVSGNVSTNDMNIPEGSTYGDCFPDPDNPSDAMPLMDENGMFTFESEVPGVFVFQVPVITPDGMEILVDLVITVLDPDIDNNVPVANVDISTTLYETEVTLSTLSNDFTGNLQSPLDPTTVAVIVSPANGMISIDPITGDITYIPNDGFVGTDILTYEVMDEDGNVSIADQIITVLPLNVTNTTTAADDNSTTGYEIPLVGSVSTNDTDAEDNTQFVVPQVITVPEGMLTLYPNGDYTFTPANEFVGPVDFPYEIFDTGGAMDMATLHILVQPPPIGEISGTAWKDANGNGVQETEENLLPGIVAVLEDCDGNMIDLTITNADGEYVFDDVPVGMVRVRFDISALPPDCVFTLQDVGDDTTDSDVNQFGQGPCIDVMQFDEIDNYSVGLIGTSSVIGFVWTDFDGDGNQHNESGIADVTITLLNADGTEYATTTSDENGNYSFVYVPIGDYFVEFTDPDGNTLSLPNATGNDSNDSDAEENGDGTSSSAIFTVSIDGPSQVDAGYYQCAQIGETVWYDVNTNDQEDSNENGLNGMVVNLYTADGILFDSDITGHKPGTPSDDGYYKFCVPPGSYYIEAVLPPQGLVPAQSNQGSDLTDSDITNANGFGTTSTFTVTSGEEKCDIGAGYYPMAEVGNFVWHDEDQNGIQNQGEQPLENVIVQVFDENNQKISEAITDELGKYNVDYLGQTQYYFKFTPPNGYAATTANATVDDYDSDITHAHGANTTNLYSLQSGDVVTHVDAGMALSVLPIEWLSVSADNRGNHNIVKWATSSEINSDYYQIERRMESESDFKSIAKEEAVGFSLDRTDYNYQDHDLSATGNYYYRIKQVDTDGSIDYSDIVVVTISRKEAQLSLYPNPARDVAVITITLDEDTEVAMSFYNADGKLIKSNLTVEQVSPGRYEKSITLDDLLPGVYRVMLRANDRVWNKDLIVVR